MTNKKQQKKNNKKAFTLVEILVVMIVLAILATLTAFGYNGIQNRSKDASVRTSSKQFADLIELKKTEKRDYTCGSCSTPADVASMYDAPGLIPGNADVYFDSVIHDNEPTDFNKEKIIIFVEDRFDSLISVAYWSIAENKWKGTVYFKTGDVVDLRREDSPIPIFDV